MTEMYLNAELSDDEIERRVRAEFPEAPDEVVKVLDAFIEYVESVAYMCRKGYYGETVLTDPYLDLNVVVTNEGEDE